MPCKVYKVPKPDAVGKLAPRSWQRLSAQVPLSKVGTFRIRSMLPFLFGKRGLGALIAIVVTLTAACGAVDTPVTDAPPITPDGRDIVVLLHGLGRSEAAMSWLARRLEEGGYRAVPIGYRSLQKTPKEILEDVAKQIDHCCIGKSPNLHFVGHSLGGLLIRAYLSRNEPANRGHVVLIGTPNAGTAVVDTLQDRWWFPVLGPTARLLGTKDNSFPNSIGPPDYPLGVIAGRKTGIYNETLLPGSDDGLVSIESTKINGMTDFVVVESGHFSLRHDEAVARHVLSFLKTGRFNKDGN